MKLYEFTFVLKMVFIGSLLAVHVAELANKWMDRGIDKNELTVSEGVEGLRVYDRAIEEKEAKEIFDREKSSFYRSVPGSENAK